MENGLNEGTETHDLDLEAVSDPSNLNLSPDSNDVLDSLDLRSVDLSCLFI